MWQKTRNGRAYIGGSSSCGGFRGRRPEKTRTSARDSGGWVLADVGWERELFERGSGWVAWVDGARERDCRRYDSNYRMCNVSRSLALTLYFRISWKG